MHSKELREKTGISRDTLRHYIDEGIISPLKDEWNGYHIFTEDDIETIQFVIGARHLGFSLQEIRSLQKKFSVSACKHKSILPHLRDNLLNVQDKIKDLKKIEKQLKSTITDFEKRDCTVKPTKLTI